MEKDPDFWRMNVGAQLLILGAKYANGILNLSGYSTWYPSWRTVVIGKVPEELRHAFVAYERFIQMQEDAQARGCLFLVNADTACPDEVVTYLFRKLHRHFPESNHLCILQDWEVAEKRPLLESILRLTGIIT